MKFFSFKWLNAFCVLISLVSSVQASNRLTGQDIKDTIKQNAKHAGIDLEAIIAAEKVFYPCEDDLQINPKNDDWKTIEAKCSLPYPWKLSVRTKIISPEPKEARKKNQPVTLTPVKTIPVLSDFKEKPKKIKERARYSYIVLAEPVTKGTVLNENMAFYLKDYNYKVRGGFRDFDQIVGRKLRHAVPEGTPILARYLTENYIVEKNTILDITLFRTGIKISGKGVALSNGQLGEIILVSNIDTGVKLKVRIKNPYEAEIIAKHSR